MSEGRRISRAALVGAWRLVSCVETDIRSGEIFLPLGSRPLGLLLYTPDGYMSAQLGNPDRQSFASGDMYRGTAAEYESAAVGYLAYSGPYDVDEVRGVVEHGMEVSLFPNWQGQRQLRIAQIEGDTLVLATASPALFAGTLKDARRMAPRR